MTPAEARVRLVGEGFSRFSAPVGRAMYSRRRDGATEYRDILGEPCDIETAVEDEDSEQPSGDATLADEACTAVRGDPALVARVLMGKAIDKPTLERLTDSGITLDAALDQYVASDIKAWLKRIGVRTASDRKDQLVALVAEALRPAEPEPTPEPEPEIPAEPTTENETDGEES